MTIIASPPEVGEADVSRPDGPRHFAKTEPVASGIVLARSALLVVLVLTLGTVVQLLFVSPLQERANQQRKYDAFRQQLAAGTAPLGAGDVHKVGAPVAYLEIPAVHVRQVVVEGTDAAALFNGPGHRRDTPLPGQAGTSVVMGRAASFGGPFSSINKLRVHDIIHVTTGAGGFDYRVIEVRRSGDLAPRPPAADGSRLVLVTAAGTPFVPSGVVLVDADMVGPGLGGSAPRFTAATLPDADKLQAIDLRTLWRLIFWLQALTAVVLLASLAWFRWDRTKTWIVFFPTFLLVGLLTAAEVTHLLPNLL